MSTRIPQDPTELRAWRDATLYRLTLRASRAERVATLEGLHERGYADVTLTDTTLLANLDNEGMTISALARKSGTTRQAASQQVAQLEREGYVVREPDIADARALKVMRTKKGQALLSEALEIVAGLEADYTRVLGRRGMGDLKSLLKALLEEIDPEGALGSQ
ncbi:MAG: MarR family transcriptional regulator [Nocardioidaceae bacterium]